MQKFYLSFALLWAIQCQNQQPQKRTTVEILNDSARAVLVIAKVHADILGVEKSVIDSVQSMYDKIPRDSAERRLAFAQGIQKRVEMKSRDMFAPIPSKEEITAKLAALKKKFLSEKDDFRDYTRYYHRAWGKYKPQRKTLTAYLNDEGDLSLKSNYYSEDWIFHTYVTILVGDEKYTTPKVETYENGHHTESVGGNIYEEVVYGYNSEIFEAISKAKPGTPIRVRFQGKEYYDDAKISESDRQALADCWEMHRLITMSK